ncbi:YjcZ family sporulation protein [Bacillus swezeyi]|uniref:Sporulation protein YjcZ n=1 Tax=Bacillus swezeyi TaxID=1925020 RepID=A0A1R1Q9G9_9BACI|nr:YjcZ family sporulation protein [Bacillus swezeyi]KAA6451773.1 YjcZ family sporulation protein [Bacillus swezeyi]KAA6482579.1 YjcZ family sporulation protein [Bacillus swezeyi]MEC1260026.1 YjcZ family sporulation protein [Bacillus swezeyi]MED1741054.1 YjcZ family sporulation protein [Bacillus swezeyi]MED2929742.1 YjcZ family sporulation protein [Bacillus swezeyi]
MHHSHYCCPVGGYGYGFQGRSTFVLIVVLFILLIIVGAAFIC